MKGQKGYAAIAALYRQQMALGDLAPGDQMPTVNAVAEQHGVARNTAVRAYELLKHEGLIVTNAGAGTVVAPRASTGAARREDDTYGRPRVSLPVRQALGLDARGAVVVWRRAFLADGRVAAIGPVPATTTPGRPPKLFTARHATREELAALEVEAPDGAAVPVLVSYSTHHDETGPVTVREDIYAPETLKEVSA